MIQWPAIELARQLTIIETELFGKIKPKECLNQNWNNKNRQTKAPSIYRMIERTNQVGNWVASEILICDSSKERVHAITKFVKVALECKALGLITTFSA